MSVLSPCHSGPTGILLALEDEIVRNVIAHRLRRRDLDVDVITSGAEVRPRIVEETYELVVIEDRLPGLTALDFLRQYGSWDVAGSPGVIVLGREGNTDELVRAFQLGAAEYLTRPLDPEEAIARIHRLADPVTPGSRCGLLLPVVPGAGLAGVHDWIPVLGPAMADGPAALAVLVVATAVLLVAAALSLTIALALNVRNRRRRARKAALREKWTPLLMEILEGERPPETFADALPSGRQRLALNFLARHASTLRGTVRTVLRRTARPLLALPRKDAVAGRPAERARALQLLGMLGTDEERDVLRASMDDGRLLVERTAAWELAKAGEAQDIPLLLDRIDRFSTLDTGQVASMLVKFGEAAARALRETLRDESKSTFVRVVAAETLRWLGDGAAAPIAEALLGRRPPPELSAALLRLLRRTGHPGHAAIVRTYCAAPVDFLRIHAARALGKIGGSDDRRILFELLAKDSSRWVALNAAESLAELGATRLLNRFSDADHPHASLVHESLSATN